MDKITEVVLYFFIVFVIVLWGVAIPIFGGIALLKFLIKFLGA